jgi:hypothetical protein
MLLLRHSNVENEPKEELAVKNTKYTKTKHLNGFLFVVCLSTSFRCRRFAPASAGGGLVVFVAIKIWVFNCRINKQVKSFI